MNYSDDVTNKSYPIVSFASDDIGIMEDTLDESNCLYKFLQIYKWKQEAIDQFADYFKDKYDITGDYWSQLEACIINYFELEE